MAEITIPPPNADGYWHFTYITTDPLDGRWYGGKRSTKKHPLSDRYLGSGNWVRKHPARNRLKRRIVAFYSNSTEVFAAEAELITWSEVLDNPLCMNRMNGGLGVETEVALAHHRDPTFRAAYEAGIAKRAIDPVWRKNVVAGVAKRTADPEWRKANRAALHKLNTNPDTRKKRSINAKRHFATYEGYVKAKSAALRRWATQPTTQGILIGIFYPVEKKERTRLARFPRTPGGGSIVAASRPRSQCASLRTRAAP